MSCHRPIFIVSAPRSGSTLLRLILDSHPALAVPPPGWLFDLVYPYLYSYGDLARDANLTALAEDILATPTISKWPVRPTPAQLVSEAPERSFAGLFAALHEAHARAGGKRRWGEKTPRHAFWMDEIKAAFPGAQFIHIVRDGRDMAIDISDSMLLPYSVYSGACYWQRHVLAVRDSASRLAAEDYHEVRYEDLCAEPERVIRAICAFLGESFDARMLSPHKTDSAKSWAGHPLHAKTAQPISTRYCAMWRQRLPQEDVHALDATIGQTLALFGYPVASTPRPVPARLATQFLESDTVTNPENVAYRRQLDERRKARRAAGVWSDADRASLLWGMN